MTELLAIRFHVSAAADCTAAKEKWKRPFWFFAKARYLV